MSLLNLECLNVKTFCCCFSLKVGTLMIVCLNQSFSLVSFVIWVSTGVIILSIRRSRDDIAAENQAILMHFHMIFGIVIIFTQLVMGIILYKGLKKECPTYLRSYIIIGCLLILTNSASMGLAIRHTVTELLIPAVVGIPFQVYFLIVIRSTLKEMLEEQKTIATPQHQQDEERGLPDDHNY